MKLTLDAKEVTEIHWKAEKEYLFRKGFHTDDEILRVEKRDPDDCHLDHVTFMQDETPEIGGDNIECEYLKALG